MTTKKGNVFLGKPPARKALPSPKTQKKTSPAGTKALALPKKGGKLELEKLPKKMILQGDPFALLEGLSKGTGFEGRTDDETQRIVGVGIFIIDDPLVQAKLLGAIEETLKSVS